MAKKFLTDINIAAGVYDSSGDIGNSGQVLSSTGSGVNWINATSSASIIYQDGFTGDGSTTAFTLANSLDNENKTQVYIEGVYQHKDNYSLSGTTLTFSSAPPNTSDIEVISFSSVSAADDILYDDDFTSAGLMTTDGSGVYSITTNNSSNWNTAYTHSQAAHAPANAEQNVQSDWTATSGDSFIQNKPTIPSGNQIIDWTADQGSTEIHSGNYINTTYTVGDGGLTQNNFTNALKTKLDGIETSADVTDTTNVTAAGALMDSELTDLAGVKAVTISDLATETYVDTAVSNLVDSSPTTLDTLNELAAALGDDPNFATTTATSIGTKLPLAGGTLTGNLTVNARGFFNSAASYPLATSSGQRYNIQIRNTNNTVNSGYGWWLATDTNFNFALHADGSGDKFTLTRTGNATFTGEVTAGGAVTIDSSGSTDNYYLNLQESGSNRLTIYENNDNVYINGYAGHIIVRPRITGGGSFAVTQGNTQFDTSGNATFAGEVTATEYNLPSSGMLDWANGDARIVEGLVNNYSLSFQTYDGSAASTALRLDGDNTATFAGTITASGYNDSNWNTAYGWGNHASGGYLTSSTGFPKGADIGGSADLNNYTTTGYYHQNSNSNTSGASNYPASVAGMLTVTNDGVMIYQIYQGYGANHTYERKYYNGTWNSWHQIYDSGVFTNNSSNWNTAYGWGNHASAGYAASSHNHAATDITSGQLPAARNTNNLVDVGGSLDAQGIYFRGTTEVISGEGWCTAQYAYNHNDGFLWLNRNSSNTAFPTFHIGGFNNAGYAGYTDADGMVTLTRSDGAKSQGSTYAGTGLSNTSYWTRTVKTTSKTIFKDAQDKHQFDGNVTMGIQTTGISSPEYGNLRVSNNGNGETTMGDGSIALQLGPATQRAGTSKPYYGGIAFNGLMNYNNSNTYDSAPHVWVGAKYHDTPGSERSYFAVGVKSGVGITSTDVPIERFTIDYSGHAIVTGSYRAPIFYDSNDTTYYTNPAGNSKFVTADFTVNASSTITLTSGGTNASQIKAGAGDELYLGGNDTWQMRLSGGNILMDNGGYALSNGSFRAPIFYASDDTAYYMDANSKSHLSKISGVRVNRATSEGWQETDAWGVSNQTGYFGGVFSINGSSNENNISYEEMPSPNGSSSNNKKGLVWKVTTNSSDSGADGGWNKTIGGVDYNKGHISVLYVKRVANGNGNFYHGTTTCENLDGSTNGNPYFQSGGSQNLPLGVWCVSIGYIRANNDSSTTATSFSGIYRLDTGERIIGATDYRFKANTTSQHRCFLYYATNTSTELWFTNPGFYEINGSEPTINELLMRPEDRVDSLRADVDMRAPLYYDSDDTGYYTNPNSLSRMAEIQFGKGSNDRNGAVSIALNDGQLLFRTNTDYNHKMWYYDGLNFSTNPGHGHIRFWADSSSRTNGSGGSTIVLDSDCQNIITKIYGQTQSPIYYDLNNTGYYVHPDSTSVIVGLTMAGALQTAGSITTGSSGTANIYMGGTSGNYFRFHTNNSHTYFDANVGDIHWRQGVSTRFTFYMTTANMTINGSLTQNSDERVKENIVEIPDAIDKVKAMKGVYYNRTDFNTGVTKVGVLAQEVEAVLPELIVEAPDSGLKSVAYGELTAVLINAIKELEARVKELENN